LNPREKDCSRARTSYNQARQSVEVDYTAGCPGWPTHHCPIKTGRIPMSALETSHQAGQDTFTFSEISDWLKEAGFEKPRQLDAPSVSPLILANKPRSG
jgi:hypothetical protein